LTVILASSVLAAGCAGAEPPGPVAPAVLPEVAVRSLDDQPVRLEAAAAGKPALVSFWATWCDACIAEMDALNRLDERARSSGGMVIGVAVGETREKAAAFARQRGLRYAQLVDEKLALADALGQKRLPATLVLDRQGKVVFTGGTLDERALAAFRDAMSAGSSPASATR
jgi:thiol-disulfide isomerase/thioredoxin